MRRVSRQKAATFAYWRRWLVVPVVFGVLTTEDLDQALARSGPAGTENAGEQGARTAVEMSRLVAAIGRRE